MLPQNNLIPFCTWYLVLLPDSSIIRSYFFQIFTPFCTVGNFGKLYVSLVIYDYERICKWSHYLAKQKSRSNKKKLRSNISKKKHDRQITFTDECNYIFAMNKLCFLFKVQLHYRHEIEILSRKNAVASKWECS